MEKTNKIQITTKASNSTVSVKNLKNIKDQITMPLKGNQIDGVYAEVFDKFYQRAMLEELYDELIDKGVVEESKESWKRVCKNVDPVIYNTLKQYDKVEKSKESKSLKYVQIMLKQIDGYENESRRQYKKRVNLVRKVELEDNGIELNYDFRNMKILGRGFWDKIKIIGNSIRNRKLSKISFFNKQDDQIQQTERKVSTEINGKELAKTIQEFSIPSRNEKKRYKAEKGLIDTLREKANNVDFRKKIGKRLVNAGIFTAIAFGAVTIFNTSKAKVTNLVNNNQAEVNSGSITENIDSRGSHQIATEKNTIEEANINIKELLEDSVNLYLGRQSSFRINDAKYWETPDGEGKSGTVKPESEVFVTGVDVTDENGLTHYKVSDGLTLNQIKEKHPNGKFSYHINGITENRDVILGWVNDKQTLSRIDAQMTNSRLKTLMNNLSPEAKEIFYNIVSNNTGKISEDNKDIIVKLINEAQQVEKQKETAEIEER